MLATQSDVRLVIREPDTPGGFKLSMACRPASKSVTADAMVGIWGWTQILWFLPTDPPRQSLSKIKSVLVYDELFPFLGCDADKRKNSKLSLSPSLAGPVNHSV